jgi:two-component sensor histidine kinase
MKFRLAALILFLSALDIYGQTSLPLSDEIKATIQANAINPLQPDSAIALLARRLQSLASGGGPAERLGLNMTLAFIHFNKKEFDQSLRHLNAARNTYNNLHPGEIHYWISAYLGQVFFHRGNYLLAGQHFSDVLGTKESKENPVIESEIRDHIIRIYNILPSYSLSSDFFIKAMDIKRNLGDHRGMEQVAQKLTHMLYEQREYEKSLKYAYITRDLASQLGLQEEWMQAQTDIANNLIRLKKLSFAKVLLDSIHSKIRPSDYHMISRYETALGDYEVLCGNQDKAEKHYAAALPGRPGPVLSQYVFHHQAESYKQVGNHAKAYEAQENYMRELTESYVSNVLPAVVQLEERSARSKLRDEVKYLNIQNELKDSLFQNQKLLANALAQSNALQESELKHQAQLREAMQTEVELQKQKVKNEQRLRMLFIGSSLALLLMGSAVFQLYRKQKTKNAIISRQAAEKETLMKEIHHRVKNNLQIISSLLDMQSLSINDPIAAEAIKEGKNRVLSMALIHQNLYHEGHIRSIKIDDYIIHLSKSLFDSYSIDQNKIELSTDIAPMTLDVDTVVPLGLIVNELITNSLKYAFSHRPNGLISVTLTHRADQQLLFQVRDNGIGFPAEWNMDSTQSFGFQLIKAFCKKIKAKLHVYNDGGAVVDMVISKYKLA